MKSKAHIEVLQVKIKLQHRCILSLSQESWRNLYNTTMQSL